MNLKLYVALYLCRDRRPNFPDQFVHWRVARFLTSVETDESVRLTLRALPNKRAQTERTASLDWNSHQVSLSDTRHAQTYAIATLIINPDNTTVSDLDSTLDDWGVETNSRASLKTAVWGLLTRKTTPDVDVARPEIDWSKLARPVSDEDDAGQVPVVARRAWWRRALGLA